MRYCILFLGVVLLLAATALGHTYVVNPERTGDFPTIQAAIDAATDGDTILLTNGRFTGDGNRDIDVGCTAITIRSQSGNPETCIIDCQGTEADFHRGFYFHNCDGAESVLQGVTITNGHVMDYGGGIYCEGASPSITNCVISGNTSEVRGAGIACMDTASPMITSCRIAGNTAVTSGAGGIYCDDSSPTIADCIITGNTGSGGGGMLSRGIGSSPAVEHCTFLGNVASNWGGGLYCDHGSSGTIRYNIFLDNEAGLGGGGIVIDNPGTSPHIHNNTIVWNWAPAAGGWNGGGGICCHSSCTPQVTRNIIAFNTGGGAIHCANSPSPTMSCNDLWGNIGGDGLCGIDGENNISQDPLFCDAASEDFHLRSNSPCAPFSPPNEECDLIGAWPVGCVADYACCIGQVCEILSEAACTGMGGTWLPGVEACDPNPSCGVRRSWGIASACKKIRPTSRGQFPRATTGANQLHQPPTQFRRVRRVALGHRGLLLPPK